MLLPPGNNHNGQATARVRAKQSVELGEAVEIGRATARWPATYRLRSLSTALASLRNSSCAGESGAYSATVSPWATASATTRAARWGQNLPSHILERGMPTLARGWSS